MGLKKWYGWMYTGFIGLSVVATNGLVNTVMILRVP
jgi:hypothetical protein